MSFKSLHGQWVLRVLRSIKLEKESIWWENRDNADVFADLMHTQIEELTSNLPQLQALSSSTSSVDSMVSSETASPRANGRWPRRSKETLRRRYWSGSSTQSPSKFLAGVCSKKPLKIEVRLWLSTHCSGCRICGNRWMNGFAAGLLSLLSWVKM